MQLRQAAPLHHALCAGFHCATSLADRYVQNLEERINCFDQFMDTFKTENDIGKKLSKLIVNI
jgi:hypothetical protein